MRIATRFCGSIMVDKSDLPSEGKDDWRGEHHWKVKPARHTSGSAEHNRRFSRLKNKVNHLSATLHKEDLEYE